MKPPIETKRTFVMMANTLKPEEIIQQYGNLSEEHWEYDICDNIYWSKKSLMVSVRQNEDGIQELFYGYQPVASVIFDTSSGVFITYPYELEIKRLD